MVFCGGKKNGRRGFSKREADANQKVASPARGQTRKGKRQSRKRFVEGKKKKEKRIKKKGEYPSTSGGRENWSCTNPRA